MPTYEYICKNCGNAWEEIQKISEPALEVCPKCSQHTAQRQISAGNFILKGGGWYSDLYSSAKPGSKASDSSGENKASSGDSGTTSKAETGSSPKESSATTTTKTESTAPKASSGSSGGGDGKSS